MPIAGETRDLIHRETSSDGSLFQVVAGSSVIEIKKPDGTLVAPAPTVVLDPVATVDSTYHNFIATQEMLEYGLWRTKWQFQVGNETRIRPEWFFVASMDLWAKVHDLVGDDITDDDIDREIAFIIRTLERDYATCLGVNGHVSLSEDDQNYFDIFLAYMVSARYVLANPDKFSSGPLRREKQGPVEWEYGTTKKPGTVKSIDEVWIDEAFDKLNLVSCFAAALVAFADGLEIMGTSGPRRGVQTSGPNLGINELYIIATVEQPLWARQVIW